MHTKNKEAIIIWTNKTFRRRPGHLPNILCGFNLPPMSRGKGVVLSMSESY